MYTHTQYICPRARPRPRGGARHIPSGYAKGTSKFSIHFRFALMCDAGAHRGMEGERLHEGSLPRIFCFSLMPEPSALTYANNRPRLLGSAAVRGCCSGREVGMSIRARGRGKRWSGSYPSLPVLPASYPSSSFSCSSCPSFRPTPLVARSLSLRLGRGYVYPCLLPTLLLTHLAVVFSFLRLLTSR